MRFVHRHGGTPSRVSAREPRNIGIAAPRVNATRGASLGWPGLEPTAHAKASPAPLERPKCRCFAHHPGAVRRGTELTPARSPHLVAAAKRHTWGPQIPSRYARTALTIASAIFCR